MQGPDISSLFKAAQRSAIEFVVIVVVAVVVFHFPKKSNNIITLHERTARRKTKIEITRERYLFHVRLQKMLVMLDSVMSETKEQLSNGFLSFEQYHSSPIYALSF